MTPVSHGKPCAGNPHARFDEGASASEEPRRKALLHKVKTILVIVSIVMTALAAFSESTDSAVKAKVPVGKVLKSPKRQQSRFSKEFSAWAAKQDWFALSTKAEFGDFNRDKMAEKGMTFGFSTEFVDSEGKKHILGIGLAKEPAQAAKMEMERSIAEMHAQKSIMMHGKTPSTDASGRKSLSVSGTLRASAVLSKTILRPGTEEKWILCVVVRHD